MATAVVTTRHQNLNVRSGPSISHSIIGKVGKGAHIEIGSDSTSSGGWTWVTYGGGWICQKDPRYTYPFVTMNPATTESTPAPSNPEPVPETKVDSGPPPSSDSRTPESIAKRWADQQGGGGSETLVAETIPLDGSAVLYENRKIQTEELKINTDYKYIQNLYKRYEADLKELDLNHPKFIQNKTGYPPVAYKPFVQVGNKTLEYYVYDYFQDYDRDKLMDDMPKIRHILNFQTLNNQEMLQYYTKLYNRYKMATTGDAFTKTYGHVFFVRPDCNIFKGVSGGNFELEPTIAKNPNYAYANYNCPEILRQLVLRSGYTSDFMMLLSNKALSFQLNDEYINSDTYGKALTGHKISYGRNNVESKTSGDFSITYSDDRDLHVYHLHKLWVDYISGVYRGEFNPRREYMDERMLDYVANVYYFLCAEDGETIIFWSKYYGVFPVTIPSSQFSWATGNVLSKVEYDVKYQYSFKEDFNPLSIVEFNINAGTRPYKYVPVIGKDCYIVNTTWVGDPFIETFNDSKHAPYTLKLKFRKGDLDQSKSDSDFDVSNITSGNRKKRKSNKKSGKVGGLIKKAGENIASAARKEKGISSTGESIHAGKARRLKRGGEKNVRKGKLNASKYTIRKKK